MFDLGIQELIVIFIVALIVFGPKRLPELGRTIGKGMAELKRAMNGVRDQIHSEYESVNRSAETGSDSGNAGTKTEEAETSTEQDSHSNKEKSGGDKPDVR